MNSSFKRALCAGLSAMALSAGAISVAHATDGYFVEGVSAREQALGGAGMANPADALTTANNPAGLVDVGRQFNGALSLFAPTRGYDASGTFLTAPGNVNSFRDVFVIPTLGYSQPLSGDSAFGLSMTGNGGMNTTYAGNTYNPMCGYYHLPQQGVFCGGRAGVDLNQGLISLGYAQRFGNLSIGIAPTLAVQTFSGYGLGAFGDFGLSSNKAEVSDHSPNYSVGGGVRAGALYHFNDQLAFAIDGATPMWMSKFSSYSGLFAGGGSFDIPAEIGAGLSYRAFPTLALMLDWKHIFYSDVKSIGDQMMPIGFSTMGAANGPGFGWRDVDVIAVGMEWKYTPALTLRAGYSYNTQPVTSANVMLNILAPGVVTNHISGGFTYSCNRNSAIDFAVVYAPRTTVSGPEYLPTVIGGPGVVPGSNIDIRLSELQVTLGYTYHFDVPPPAVIAKY